MHPVAVRYPASERRFLPAVPDGFELGEAEPLAMGLRRITVEQLDGAITAMISEEEIGAAVHEVRKTAKRIRAVLRLVRPVLGPTRYRAENGVLRDTARLLSPIRDADVRVATLGVLRDRFAAQLRPSIFTGVEERLSERRRRVHDAVVGSGDWSRAIYTLRSARARYAAWPADEESAAAHGMKLIIHGFDSMERGLARTYARGREEMGEARRKPTADNFHAWRKRAKYLRHQLEVLTPIWPDGVGGHAASLERLGDLLGEEHDLAELLRLLAARPDLHQDPIERSLLVALSQHRRAELQTAALSLGSRVYAEPVGRFVERLGDYWRAWDRPTPVGFTV